MARKTTITAKILADNSGLKAGVRESSGILSDFASGAGSILKGGAAAAGVAVAASVTAGFIEAMDQQGLAAKFGEQLGLGSGAAKEFIEDAAAVYSNNWGGSVEEVAQVLADIQGSKLGETVGDDLENAGIQALALADKYDVDVTEAINAASEAVSAGLVDSADEAFDLFDAGLGAMPATIREELFAASNEYGDFFADLGFNGEETFSRLTGFAESGVFGIDKFGDAIKELTIRGTDASASSREAFEAMGKDADLYAELLLEGGDAARDATFGIIRGLQGIEDPVEQANAAIALFGTPLEDLGTSEIPAFLEAMQGAGEGLTVVEGQALATAEAMGDTLQSKLSSIRRKGFQRLAEFIGDKVLPVVEDLVDQFLEKWPDIQKVVGRVVKRITNFVKKLTKEFKKYWPQIQEAIEVAMEFAVEAIERIVEVSEDVVTQVRRYWPRVQETIEDVIDVVLRVVSALVDEFKVYWPQIQEIIEDVWDAIEIAVKRAIQAVKAIIETTVAVISTIWDKWGEDITKVATDVWNGIRQVISGVLDVIQGIIRTFTSVLKGDWSAAWEAIKQTVSGAWEAIKGTVSAAIAIIKGVLSAAWAGIKAGASAGWNGIKGAIDAAWESIKGAASSALSAVRGVIVAAWNGIKSWIRNTAQDFYDAALAVFDRAKAGVTYGINLARSAVIKGFNGIKDWIVGLATTFYNAGRDLFTKLKDGLKAGLEGIGQFLLDAVVAPLQSIYDKVTDILGGIRDFGPGIPFVDLPGGGGGDAPEVAPPVIFNADGVDIGGLFHDGGPVGRIRRSTTRALGIAPNESINLLEAGEFVLTGDQLAALETNGGSSQPTGPLIGNLIVQDGRSIDDELRLAQALRGQ